MAAPTYSTDFTTVALAESLTNYNAINQGGGGGGAPALGRDLAMQGLNCVDRPVNNTERGIYYQGATSILDTTNPFYTGGHVWQWVFNATPGVTNNLANRGLTILVGNDENNHVQYHVEGIDTYGATGRVARCYPIAISLAHTTTVSPPYRTLVGTLADQGINLFGASMFTTGAVRGSNLGVDACRIGTGVTLRDGEVANPCSFTDYSIFDDGNANLRYGVLINTGGVFELQGKFQLGLSVSQPVYFSEANFTILVNDTPHSTPTFNKILGIGGDSLINWTNGTIKGLGATNKLAITMDRSNINFNVSGGAWDNLGIINLSFKAVVNLLTILDCELVIQNWALITNSVFSNTLLQVNSIENVTNNNFVSGGANHGLELSANHIVRNGGTTPNLTGIPTIGNYTTSASTNNITTRKHVLIDGVDRMVLLVVHTGGNIGVNGGVSDTATYNGIAMSMVENWSSVPDVTLFYLLESQLPSGNFVEYDVTFNRIFTSPSSSETPTLIHQINNAEQVAPTIGAFRAYVTSAGNPKITNNTLTKDNGLVLRSVAWQSTEKTNNDTTILNEELVFNESTRQIFDYVQGGLSGTTVTTQDTTAQDVSFYACQTFIIYPASTLNPVEEVSTINWNNNTEGFASVNGSTGNEAIHLLATSGTLNITVNPNVNVPSIRTEGATVNILGAQASLTLTGLVSNTEIRIYEAGTLTELDGVEDSGTTFTYTYTFAPSTFVDIVVHNIDYQYIKLFNIELGASNASLPIQQRFDRNYTNPAGPSPDITLFSGAPPRSEWVVTYDFIPDTSSISLYWENALVFTESVAGFNQELFDSVSRIGTDGRRYLRSTFQLNLGEFTGTEDAENYYSITQKGI